MARPKYSGKEKEIIGTYPGIKVFEVAYNSREIPETPRYNRPITVRENWKLLLSGKKPYWIPTTGWARSEQNQFRPRLCPDNVANHQIFDGGPTVDCRAFPKVMHSEWFGLDWEWEPKASGATVRPGNPLVKDINEWEKYTSIPNLDDLDWDSYVEENRAYLSIDKLQQLGIQFGLWERLMCLMDVDRAAMALVDEDQKEGVHRFFNALCDFYDDYIGRIASLYPIDCVYIHDDWAHQKGPFFSPDTAREMIMPYMKRVAESAHKRGLFFEQHCCGKAEMLVPVMIEAGVDMWCGQGINDQDALAHKYRGEPFVVGVMGPDITADNTEEEIRRMAIDWVKRYKDCRVAAIFNMSRYYGTPQYQLFEELVYEYSRKAFEDYD